MMIRNVLLVAIGGALGAALRYLISYWMWNRWPTAFPIGTLTVNVLGCFVIGLLAHAGQASTLSPGTKLMLTTGTLGALTTFSTFSIETLACLENHNVSLAAANVGANVILSLVAVVAGSAIGRAM